VTYTVACGDGIKIAVERHRPAPSDILPTGVRVAVAIPRAALLAFDPITGARA
jgi:hypothetical protein